VVEAVATVRSEAMRSFHILLVAMLASSLIGAGLIGRVLGHSKKRPRGEERGPASGASKT
jgi:hypothetical protein